MTSHRLYAAIASALAALLLTGCMVGPKYQRPPALAQAPPASYKETAVPSAESGDWKVAQPQDAMLHGKWWEIYNDPELNALEDKLNIDNQTIKQYFANFMEARTLIAQARAQLYPTLTAAPSFSRSLSSGSLTNASTANAGKESSITTMGLDASWAPDLWGKVRNTIREEQYNAQLSESELEGERLTEQATLAITFFEVRGQDALKAVYDQTVAADQKALDLTRSQYETGVTQEISVVEAENTLENAQAISINLGLARAEYQHAIAVLTGTDPSSFSIPVKSLNAAPPAVPIGVPSQLLERRPDIAASERAMAAANAQIGVATAAYFPSLTLSGSDQYTGSAWSTLFSVPNRIWSVGPTLAETVLDGGLRRAQVAQARAAYEASVDNYRQTVLLSFEQVEDQIATLRILQQQAVIEEAAVNAAREAEVLTLNQYKAGTVPYSSVITAQTTQFTSEETALTVLSSRLQASVALIEALGGGWTAAQLPH